MGELVQVKSRKHTTSIRNGKRTFFFYSVIFEVRLPHCQSTIAMPKTANVERHFRTVHKNLDADFPPKSELRKRKLKELKSQLSGQQSFFSHLTSKAKAATEASFRVSHLIIKNKKSFQDGEMVKDRVKKAADSLCKDERSVEASIQNVG